MLKLLLPAGILESEIDQGWLATIGSFGKDRGGAAHQGYVLVARVQQPPDPGDEASTVDQIVAKLDAIEELLRAAATPPGGSPSLR